MIVPMIFCLLVFITSGAESSLILDCATGTGDLALEFKRRVGPTGSVLGTDFCQEMLASAPEKARRQGLEVAFELADVTQLQYAKDSFDRVSISFGIRNVGNPVKALQEMARVTRPGGRVLILEFGQISLPVLGQAYSFYSEKILPKLGGLVTGQTQAYDYLQKSSAAFPCREEFLEVMKQSQAFSSVNYTPVSFGIAYIYQGIVSHA
jgi:demethylmenaquinone methyltransferase / 2-methoxy-6-polyprenyl-1,4-benzoquinol methylase